MTVTVTPRRAGLVALAVLALTIVYILGASRSGGAVAPSGLGGTANVSTLGNTTLGADTPGAAIAAGSKLFPTIQTGTTPGAPGPGITVGGKADVAGTPDTLRLDLSVTASANSVSEALASANRSAGAVQKSLLANGVQKKDLQTSGLSIQPDYEYPNGGTPRLKGYQVSQSVIAKLRNLGTAGDAIAKAVAAGGNAVRVNGVSLDLEETGALVSSARDKAFADARAKAAQYAKAAGRSLGAVISINEDVSSSPPPSAMSPTAADSLKQGSAVPIQPGSQNVSVSVTVVFAMA